MCVLIWEFFGNSIPWRLIHVMTRSRKSESETVLKYMSEMKRWGRTAGMDDRTIGQFVVDGLDMEDRIKIRFSRITDLRGSGSALKRRSDV